MQRLALLLFGLWLSGCALVDPRQRDPSPPGGVRIETILVDGLPERLLIRGSDLVHNPVLLFVHGGPGFPNAPFRQVYSGLEQSFTVVDWDQRGAGYSYFTDIPPATMKVEQFVRETLIVARYLRRELRQPKIYLLGHSWGTLPAILAVQKEPQLFYAYVAISQLVDLERSERELTTMALRYAQEKHAYRQARQLQALGPTPYRDLPSQDRAAKIVASLFPHVQKQATPWRLGLMALTSRYYSFAEILRANRSYRFSRALLDPQLLNYRVDQLVRRIDVPVYFFVGAQDAIFGLEVQRDYWLHLLAPRGKTFVVFDQSTHWPHLEQPASFIDQMRRVRAETWR